MKVVTFGEILLRINPQGYFKLFQNHIMETSFCGSEANVAVSLANFGIKTLFVTKVPDNVIGQAAINALRYFGVDTTKIIRGGKRLGLYFLEKGASQRSSKIYYDRAFSAITESAIGTFNWEQIFTGADWYHFSGITPALGPNLEVICLDAIKKAKEKGMMVSCDLNYRNKLWTSEKANQVMSRLMPYIDICIANEEDPETVFGINTKTKDNFMGDINYENYKNVALEIHNRYGCKYVAITLRNSISASANKWAGLLYSGKEENKCFISKEYEIQLVDRVGGGDSFAAGLIYSLLKKMSMQDCIDFAVAASCLKQTIEGDFNRVNVNEVKEIMLGNESGRVKR